MNQVGHVAAARGEPSSPAKTGVEPEGSLLPAGAVCLIAQTSRGSPGLSPSGARLSGTGCKLKSLQGHLAWTTRRPLPETLFPRQRDP